MPPNEIDNDLSLQIVDVFSNTPLSGNPAAIILGAGHLDIDQLQRIATFLNLSETVFILSPSSQNADFRARTFTTRREIPFAGHATLAAAHAVFETTTESDLIQECDAGLIRIQRTAPHAYSLRLPKPRMRISNLQSAELTDAFNLPEAAFMETSIPLAGAGPLWGLARLDTTRRLADIQPNHTKIAARSTESGCVGIVAYAVDKDGIIQLRTFAPAEGIFEDPVCGSCAASIAVYLSHSTSPGEYHFSQGSEIRRQGTMTVKTECVDGALVTILTGQCSTAVRGKITSGHIAGATGTDKSVQEANAQ